MRKRWLTVSAIAVATVALLGGCATEDARMAEIEAGNMAVVRNVHAEIAKGNIGVFNEVLKPDYIRHCQAMPPELQELHGTEQFMAFINDFAGGVSNLHETIDLMMADGDKVAYVTTMTGTHTGPMGGLPASGKDFSVVNIIIHRLEDGKIAETWVSWDNVAMLSQLGFFPPPQAAVESENK